MLLPNIWPDLWHLGYQRRCTYFKNQCRVKLKETRYQLLDRGASRVETKFTIKAIW